MKGPEWLTLRGSAVSNAHSHFIEDWSEAAGNLGPSAPGQSQRREGNGAFLGSISKRTNHG